MRIIFGTRSPDYYHTCYCLSGLSVAQRETQDLDSSGEQDYTGREATKSDAPPSGSRERLEGGLVLGDAANLVHAVVPEFNLRPCRVEGILAYYCGY